VNYLIYLILVCAHFFFLIQKNIYVFKIIKIYKINAIILIIFIQRIFKVQILIILIFLLDINEELYIFLIKQINI
jgi:hypothetical protein